MKGNNKTPEKKLAGSLGGPGRIIVTTLIIFLVSQIIAAFIAELGLSIFQPGSKLGLDNSVPAQFVYILIAEGLSAWFVLKIVKARGLKLSFIGLGRRPNKDDALKALIGFGVFYLIVIVVTIIVNAFWPDVTSQKQNVGFNNLHTGWEQVLAFISLVLLPPLGEEVLVRGYLYSGLRKVWDFVPALLATSLIFGLAHLELGSGGPLVWAAAIDTFFLSVVLVHLRERTGALYSGMAVHMLNNLLAFFVVIK